VTLVAETIINSFKKQPLPFFDRWLPARINTTALTTSAPRTAKAPS
jgi:hypothetical protein